MGLGEKGSTTGTQAKPRPVESAQQRGTGVLPAACREEAETWEVGLPRPRPQRREGGLGHFLADVCPLGGQEKPEVDVLLGTSLNSISDITTL